MSVKIGEIYGVPIRLHFTLVFIVALVAFSVGYRLDLLAEVLGLSDLEISVGLQSYLIGVVVAVGLFVSVLIHELAHSIVSIKSGFDVDEISLWIFGGVSKIEEMPTDPNLEIKISAVGPLSSLALAGILFIGGSVSTGDSLIFVLYYLSFLNLFLAGFNLIPAFPMDGGRILRAIMAKRYSYIKATKTASTVGKIFAILFGVIGFFVNIFLILIAFFIYMAASQESQRVVIEHALSKLKIKNIMTKDVTTIDENTTIDEFLNMVTSYQHTGFPVVSKRGIVGIITLTDAKNVPEKDIYTTQVKDVMETDIVCLSPDDDANRAWKIMTQEGFGRFPVLDNDELIGIVTRSDIMHSFEIQKKVETYKDYEDF